MSARTENNFLYNKFITPRENCPLSNPVRKRPRNDAEEKVRLKSKHPSRSARNLNPLDIKPKFASSIYIATRANRLPLKKKGARFSLSLSVVY